MAENMVSMLLQSPKIDFRFRWPLKLYVLAICKDIRVLRKHFSTLLSKDVKIFFIKELYCHAVNYTIQLATTENPLNFI